MSDGNDDRAMPGPVAIFGSGETAPEAQRVHDVLMRRAGQPIHACVLETPAGFELNSEAVAGRLATFLRDHLPNYRPEVAVVPARRRGTPFSPDDPEIARPIFAANYLLAGPGSPTYAVRQLRGSRAWQATVARHRLGATLVFASAMSIAISYSTLPVYEIYKAGHDPHWTPGLDLFGPYGLMLAIVPHWNNAEGGASLDTSRCFMGVERFATLAAMLEPGTTIVGIDEHTALVVDLMSDRCEVFGLGEVTVVRDGHETAVPAGGTFPVSLLGTASPIDPRAGLSDEIWTLASEASVGPDDRLIEPDQEVLDLLARRNDARSRRDWPEADRLRTRIGELGWQVADNPSGSTLSRAARRQGSTAGG